MKESDYYGHYILDDGEYYIPDGEKLITSGFFITESGYLYRLTREFEKAFPTKVKFQFERKVNTTEVEKVVREIGAVLAKKVN